MLRRITALAETVTTLTALALAAAFLLTGCASDEKKPAPAPAPTPAAQTQAPAQPPVTPITKQRSSPKNDASTSRIMMRRRRITRLRQHTACC